MSTTTRFIFLYLLMSNLLVLSNNCETWNNYTSFTPEN